MGVKRWIGLILIGTTFIGFGLAVLLLQVYYAAEPESWYTPILAFLSLRFLSRGLRAIIFAGIGVTLVVVGITGLNQTLLRPFVQPGKTVVDAVSAFRKRDRGPRIVVIGGGTGLSAVLRGLKTFSRNITAIVTVADDGGSSGELRKNIGVLPPGDIRNCLAALSSDEELLSQLFQYRFATGSGLSGHNLGNLLITALTDITGSFEDAIAETGRVLAVQGTVLPSTLHNVHLVADVQLPHRKNEVIIKGESEIPKLAGKVKRVWLEPGNPQAFPPAIQAILSADLILVGPGSLYTSIMANLLVPAVADALRASRAIKFFICNIATQPGETDGYTCGDHVRAIENHLGGRIFDIVIYNKNYDSVLPETIQWVLPERQFHEKFSNYGTDLVDLSNPWRHDSMKVSRAVMDLFLERTGPLSSREEGVS